MLLGGIALSTRNQACSLGYVCIPSCKGYFDVTTPNTRLFTPGLPNVLSCAKSKELCGAWYRAVADLGLGCRKTPRVIFHRFDEDDGIRPHFLAGPPTST